MPLILRRPQAEADLDEIWLHIAQDNPDAADRFIDLIESSCEGLARNPLMGRLRPNWAKAYVAFR